MQLGTGGMVLAAVLCTLVPGANALIAARTVDGVRKALVNPLALAVLAMTFGRRSTGGAGGAPAAADRLLRGGLHLWH